MNIAIILLELLAKSILLLAAASFCALLMRHASAARRHLVWAAAFAALLALPLTKLLPSPWPLPIRQPAPKITASPVSFTVSVENLQTLPVVTPAKPRMHFPGWCESLAGIWLAGCVILLGRTALGNILLARLKRNSATCTNAGVLTLACQIAAEFGVARKVDIRFSPGAIMPMTWGIWRPVLMLPADIATWEHARLESALRHEFGHIARGDCLTRLLAQVASVLYWPNPLTWTATRALQAAQEEACDDLVLSAGASADEYATLLLDTGRKWRAHDLLSRHAIAMARPAALEKRVRAIVDDSRDRRPAAPVTKLTASLGLALALALCALAQISTAQDAPFPAAASGNWPPAREGFVTVTYDAPSKLITPADGGYLGPDGKKYPTSTDLLEANGVDFPDGASANYLKTNGKFVVRNTIDNQNVIGKILNLPAIPHPVGKTKAFFDAILPKVSFKDVSVGDCVAYFHKMSVELDTTEADSAKRGINIVLKLPGPNNPDDNFANKKVTLELTNVSYREAFKKFVALADLYAYSEPYALVLVPLDEPGNPQAKTIHISGDGKMDLNGIPMSGLQELEQKLRDAHAADPGLVIIIAAGDNVSPSQIKDLADLMKKLSIKQVGVQSSPSDSTPTPAPHAENNMNIDSDTSSFEDGVATAKGHAELKSGMITIKADAIKYVEANRTVEATGHVSFERHDAHSDTTTSGEKVSYNVVTQKLDSDGKIITTPK